MEQPLPQTIDEVITELEAILDECSSKGSRAGYFAALYHKVTCEVKEGIQQSRFEDGARMERLDVLFANRYITAYRQWKKKEPVTSSWRAAFETAGKRRPLLLQHLLLGINAHINLDLGIAAVETVKGMDLRDMLGDFNAINVILAALSYEVINDINRMSPLMSVLGFHASKGNSILVQFTLGNARDGAWMFANELFGKKDEAYDACIAERDSTIAQLAQGLSKPGGVLRFTTWLIRLFEWSDPKRIIHELRFYRKAYIKVTKASEEVG